MQSVKDSLFLKHDFLVSDSTLYFNYLDYNQLNRPDFCESGCYQSGQINYSKLLSIQGKDLTQGYSYIARFWMYNGGVNQGQDAFNGMAFFEKEKEGVKEWIFPITSMQKTQEINGDWNMVEVKLSNVDTNTNYQLLLKGGDRSKLNYYIDDVIFYNEHLMVYKENDYNLFKNGHRIPRTK